MACAAITTLIAVAGLISVSIATSVNGVTLLAVPVAIAALVLSLLGGALAFLFRKDILCRIAVFIYLFALIVSATAVTVWLTVL